MLQSQSLFSSSMTVPGRPSTASRRVIAVRQYLCLLAICLFVLTGAIVLPRGIFSSSDLTIVLPIPLLAALSVLPVVAPAFFFLLEALGTARILTTVHPYAALSKRTPIPGDEIDANASLLLRYLTATCLSRLSLWDLAQAIHRFWGSIFPSALERKDQELLRVPPASLNLLEKLGVATAFTLIDDDIICEPDAVPQQLLIPSGKGLKLLDLCRTYDDGDDASTFSESYSRSRGASFADSDSDSADSQPTHSGHNRSRVGTKRHFALRNHVKQGDCAQCAVEFEDPSWWQFLPSLKCIGLACMAIEENRRLQGTSKSFAPEDTSEEDHCLASLVRSICYEKPGLQLGSLAQCIGFNTQPNANGAKGDMTPFAEHKRIHILSSSQVRDCLCQDAHERSSCQSRWWSFLRPDSTSVAVKDSRTRAFQLLTIGDPSVVIDLCQEAWQGEISTILPLGAVDRQTVIETTNNWKLADLDVTAFSYSPVPYSLEQTILQHPEEQLYLLDHTPGPSVSVLRDKSMSPDWSLVKNQIFLGVLGSLVVPREEVQFLLPTLADAGVRFVYFSPRNMRRQKELASQMGIDVAWNCAISLRPLESGKEDPHRMVSNYADWDVNAKLPHGVPDVRKHLEEVDNVPLLVSLYTDVTKETTKEMVEIFQDYNDTVISVGLSHLPRNDRIFSAADIAVGIDVIPDPPQSPGDNIATGHVLAPELRFVSSMAARSCVFRFPGAASISHISTIIEQGRIALDASLAASVFVMFGFVAYSLFILFSVCVPSTVTPYIPVLGTVLFLQFLLPGLGFTMALSDGDKNVMNRVPAKNDQSASFVRKDEFRLYGMVVLKALPSALLPQIFHFLVFGELLLHNEPLLVSTKCPGASSWVHIVRCQGLKSYSGPSRLASGLLVLEILALCVTVSSAGFLSRIEPLYERSPWKRNSTWVVSICLALLMNVIYCYYSAEFRDIDAAGALPWYFYLLCVVFPFLCLAWIELCKRHEIRQERRADMLRRLQFETRLGAWSPK